MKYFIRNEVLAYAREPFALFFSIILPFILSIFYGNLYGEYQYNELLTGYDVTILFIIVFLAANMGLMGLIIVLSEKKMLKLDKRMNMLPINKMQVFIINISSIVIVSFVITVVIILFNMSLYPISIKFNFLFYLTVVGVYFLFYLFGYVISLYITSTKTAQTVGTFLFFLFMFLSGLVIPLDFLGETLQKIAMLTPMALALDLLIMSQDVGSISEYQDAVVVYVVLVMGLLVAIQFKSRSKKV